jgi:hypothetical protein
MINFLTFGMNLFLMYRMFLMARQSHKNSDMRFSVLFRRRIEANIMVLLCWRSCTSWSQWSYTFVYKLSLISILLYMAFVNAEAQVRVF